jgi:hypothetical protein
VREAVDWLFLRVQNSRRRSVERLASLYMSLRYTQGNSMICLRLNCGSAC